MNDAVTPPSRLRFASIVFDLDGTLVDSLPGIEASTRAALAACQPQRTLLAGALRPLVGPPLARIFATLWPDLGTAEIDELVTAYRAHYIAGRCAQADPFPDVTRLLHEFHGAGARLFLLTNKPRAQARLILGAHGWTELFEEISCPDDALHPFASKADGAVSLRERAGLAAGATLLVGDAADDLRAASAAGFKFVAAAYGYGAVAGHGSSSGEIWASIGGFAEMRPLILQDPSSPPPHDHPQSLR